MKTPRNLPQAFLGAFVLFTCCATGLGAAPVVESPVGSFNFDAPGDPPSGPPLITPMVYLNGVYTDNTYFQGASTVLTMDSSGKVMSMNQVPGFTDKKEGDTVARTLFVRTVNGIPVLTANASAGGMYDDGADDSATSGSGKATVPFNTPSAPDTNGNLQVSVMSSFSGKRDKDSDKSATQMNTLDLDVSQLQGVVFKAWGMSLTIEERIDTRRGGAKFYVADMYFTNPDGTHTFFPARTIKYSAVSGYTIAFSKGQLYDANNTPVLDTKSRSVIDKNTQIKFSNLLFKKLFNSDGAVSWTPAAGGVTYKFLGQNGFGQIFNFVITDGSSS